MGAEGILCTGSVFTFTFRSFSLLYLLIVCSLTLIPVQIKKPFLCYHPTFLHSLHSDSFTTICTVYKDYNYRLSISALMALTDLSWGVDQMLIYLKEERHKRSPAEFKKTA